MGGKMFRMERIGRWEVVPNSNLDAIQTYNTMHVGYLMQMERDIEA
jgi:hypothetical protein